ncbi:MAG: Acetamidase, partial [uncultured Rubrobacteraceae bacterium]
GGDPGDSPGGRPPVHDGPVRRAHSQGRGRGDGDHTHRGRLRRLHHLGGRRPERGARPLPEPADRPRLRRGRRARRHSSRQDRGHRVHPGLGGELPRALLRRPHLHEPHRHPAGAAAREGVEVPDRRRRGPEGGVGDPGPPLRRHHRHRAGHRGAIRPLPRRPRRQHGRARHPPRQHGLPARAEARRPVLHRRLPRGPGPGRALRRRPGGLRQGHGNLQRHKRQGHPLAAHRVRRAHNDRGQRAPHGGRRPHSLRGARRVAHRRPRVREVRRLPAAHPGRRALRRQHGGYRLLPRRPLPQAP